MLLSRTLLARNLESINTFLRIVITSSTTYTDVLGQLKNPEGSIEYSIEVQWSVPADIKAWWDARLAMTLAGAPPAARSQKAHAECCTPVDSKCLIPHQYDDVVEQPSQLFSNRKLHWPYSCVFIKSALLGWYGHRRGSPHMPGCK